MESRKVQKVGTSTLTVSLPRGWASKRNLKKGDQVFLLEEGEVLKIVPAASVQERRRRPQAFVIDANLCDRPGMLERMIVGNYVLGRESIVVLSSGRLSSEHLEETRNAAKRLMGLGIIEETANKIILQCSIEPTKYPIDALIKRLYNLGSTMLDEAVEALITKDKRLALDAVNRENDADMMYWLILRLLLSAQENDELMEKLGIKSRLEIAGYRLISKELETVADHGEEIANSVLALIERDTEISYNFVKGLKQLSEMVRALYSNGIAALLSRDVKLANGTITMKRDFDKAKDGLLRILFAETSDPTVLLHFRSILHGVERMGEYSQSIAVIAINRYLEKPSNLCKPLTQ